MRLELHPHQGVDTQHAEDQGRDVGGFQWVREPLANDAASKRAKAEAQGKQEAGDHRYPLRRAITGNLHQAH